MIQTVNLYEFRRAFELMERKNFSYAGQEVLFEYLEECDPQYDLDVIELCCDYTEDTPENIAEQHDVDIKGLDDDEVLTLVLDYLQDNTSVAGHTDDGRIVYLSW